MKKLLQLFILIPFLSFSQVQIGQDIDGKYGGYQSGNSVSSSSNGNIVAIGSPYRGGAGAVSSGHVAGPRSVRILMVKLRTIEVELV